MSQASSFKPPFFTLYLLFGGLFAWLYASDPNWKTTAEVLGSCVAIAWALSLINIWPLSNGLGRLLGLRPRTLWGLLGIACSPFLHRDLAHLMANTVPFLVLGWLVLLQREIQGNSDFLAVTLTIVLIGGLGTWLLGRDAIHLGASGLVFGYIGFLLAGAYVGPTVLTLGLAIIVFWMYGSQLWGMLPRTSEDRVSWEGHLFGFAGGIVAGLEPGLLGRVGERLVALLLN
ncbi:MAG: rhomboid-related protein [Phormidesmis priestleyi Ana]|uniref:Rhomboid-related protein n=1 Tax=Phormidesmis priestleyi Ana TaxID=1666911 RepID=A0A0N8KMG7_9CYAN|nr:MAG: rhomboid-related protein [Phormidesmis priestleyi Ana]